jgi:iron complex outermembrane receptor protein
VYLSSKLAIYGGFTRGLEESDVAPANAINRNEAPPAIITRQFDLGFRYALAPGLSLVAGYFNVEKPYFNLDTESRFRRLGTVTNRGFEASIAGRLATGLTVNAGATWLPAKVSGEQVEAGLIGDRPIGNFKLRTLANVNWEFPWHKPLTLTARFESTSSRVSNRANTLFIPARSVTSLGGRYRTSFGKTPVLIRATVDNIFDKFGWGVGGSGFFFPNAPRRFSVTVAADF